MPNLLSLTVNRLWVIGVAQAIYGLALKPNYFDEVVLVRISEFESKSGNRNFQISSQIISQLCEILQVNFSYKELDEVRNIMKSSGNNWVDLAIIYRLRINVKRFPMKVLAYQSEYVHIMRPTIWKCFNFSFIKRIDLLRKIVLPCKIREFYSLAPKGLRNLFFTEYSFPEEEFLKLRSKLAREFVQCESYKFLKRIESCNPKRILLLLPFASHFGGSKEFNKRLLERGLEYATDLGIRSIIIKNHPSDIHDYREFLSEELLSKFDVLSLNGEIERTYPLEILLGMPIQWAFYGVESTSLLTSGDCWFTKPIVVEELGWRSIRHRNYDLGEIRNLYQANRVFI
jgi:hypothetical protein